MFRCTVPPPEEGSGAFDLNTPYNYFHSSSERVNEVHKEAFHNAIREETAKKLVPYDIHKHYIIDSTTVVANKPEGQHIPVLMTKVSKLKAARDVIIVVGESGQDLGIWAWRLVQNGNGGEYDFENGTAVGLAAAVKEYGDSLHDGGGDESPAIIMLNPGQLYYSYNEKKAMTLVSWNARAREDGLQDAIPVDEANLMKGHVTAAEHVDTFLSKILPNVVSADANLYMIAIGDGAENSLTVLNERFADKSVNPVTTRNLAAVALVVPVIPQGELHDKLLHHVAVLGKSWVQSDKPIGELLAVPEIKPLNAPSLNVGSPGNGLSISDGAGSIDADAVTEEYAIANGKKEDEQDSDSEEDSKSDFDGPHQPQIPPIAPTFSCGEEEGSIPETAFPYCIHHVLKFLWIQRESGLQLKASSAKVAAVKEAHPAAAEQAALMSQETKAELKDAVFAAVKAALMQKEAKVADLAMDGAPEPKEDVDSYFVTKAELGDAEPAAVEQAAMTLKETEQAYKVVEGASKPKEDSDSYF